MSIHQRGVPPIRFALQHALNNSILKVITDTGNGVLWF